MHPLHTLIESRKRQTRNQPHHRPQRARRSQRRPAVQEPRLTVRRRIALGLAAIVGRS
jgi:hypothetical protein